MGKLYEYIDTWDGHRLFIYVTIAVFVIWVFYKQNFGINILIGIIIANFVINYANHRSINTTDTQEEIHNVKIENINPKPKQALEEDNLVNFLF